MRFCRDRSRAIANIATRAWLMWLNDARTSLRVAQVARTRAIVSWCQDPTPLDRSSGLGAGWPSYLKLRWRHWRIWNQDNLSIMALEQKGSVPNKLFGFDWHRRAETENGRRDIRCVRSSEMAKPLLNLHRQQTQQGCVGASAALFPHRWRRLP